MRLLRPATGWFVTSLEHEERALGSVQSSHTKNIVVTCLLDTVWLRKLAKTLTDLRSQAVTPVKPLDVLGRSQTRLQEEGIAFKRHMCDHTCVHFKHHDS
jgi:hypothetical protein